MSDHKNRAAIIDYWRAVELFSPQNIPRIAPDDSTEPVFSVQEHMPLPWEHGHPLKGKAQQLSKRLSLQVYCGVYSLQKVRDVLEDKLGKDPESFDERPDNESCLFAFSVADDGRPLFDTFVVSTCAWATGQTLKLDARSADWLIGFDAFADKLANTFAEQLAVLQDDDYGEELKNEGLNIGRPIAYPDILSQTKRIAEELGVPNLSDDLEIRVKATFIFSNKKYSADDQDFLNSFFLKDLAKVAGEIRHKNLGEGLYSFLIGKDALDISKRTDVRKSSQTLFEQLAPNLFPPGRWPSKGHHPLVFSQQFAVNSMVQQLMPTTGLFAVNGPPGTGKTTLLRDLIAAVVVERATRLSELSHPKNAFDGEKRWKTGEYNRVISVWKEQFKGFEIVVASTNNVAVENVTLEIPGIDTVDASWLQDADYFADFGSRLINQPAWAMVAAPLGKKVNRNKFVKNFWYGDEEKDKKVDESSDEDIASAGFLKLLKSLENEPSDWNQAVTSFKKAQAEEQRLQKERTKVHQDSLDLTVLLQEASVLEDCIEELKPKRFEATAQQQAAQDAEDEAVGKVKEAKNCLLKHQQSRPGFWKIVCSFGKALKEWCNQDKALKSFVDEAGEQSVESTIQKSKCQKQLDSIDQEINHKSTQLTSKRQAIGTKQDNLDKAREKFGEFFSTQEKWDEDEQARELSSPWSDPEWNKARAKVFLEALNLHKAFIVSNANQMRMSLQGAMDVLSGSVPDTAAIEAVEAAWTTLFFVIPVISTTFASFDRLFSHLGREKLGWLLIDEAGQAIPQAATGAIWRAKRTVVVGDPLQLEPIVTIPFTCQQALRHHYKVDEDWLPSRTSTQKLADRVNQLGTYVNVQDELI